MFGLSILLGPAGFFLSPLGLAISRRFERQADLFAAGILADARPLAMALKKMARENLSNLRPHRLYVVFNYSHPPLLERVRSLSASTADRNES